MKLPPEYIIVQWDQSYFYARGYLNKDGTFDKYKIMAACREKEARMLVEKGNEGSTWNRETK